MLILNEHRRTSVAQSSQRRWPEGSEPARSLRVRVVLTPSSGSFGSQAVVNMPGRPAAICVANAYTMEGH